MYWKSHIVRFSCLTLSKSFRGFSRLRSKMFPSIGQTGGPGGKFLGLRDLSWTTMKTTQINSRIIDANMVEGTELKSLLAFCEYFSVLNAYSCSYVWLTCGKRWVGKSNRNRLHFERHIFFRIWLELSTKISVYILLNFFHSHKAKLFSWLC